MIKQYLICTLGSFILLSGCKKAANLTGPVDKSIAYVSFTNVNGNSKTVNVYVDDVLVNTAAAVGANGTATGTYLGVYPGERFLEVKENADPATYYHSNNIKVAGGNSYAYFIYDTLKSGRFKGILLTADRNINPASASAKVRFLNLSPKAPAFDVWFVRRVGAVAKDSSKVFSAVPSLTSVANPDATALSAYTNVAANEAAGAAGTGSLVTDYIIRIKLANTNTIVSSTAATTVVNGRTYTLFARGIYPASGLTLFLNN